MSIRQFIIKSAFVAAFFALIFSLTLVAFRIQRETARIESLMRFTTFEVDTILEHFVEDMRSRIRVVKKILLSGKEPLRVWSGVFYIVDEKNHIIKYISDDRLKELIGIKLNPKQLKEGVDYSFIQDTMVVRLTSNLDSGRILVYEERFDRDNPIKSFIDRFVKNLPWNFTIMIVNPEGKIIHFKKEWTFFVGGKLSLVSRIDNLPLSQLKVIEVGDSEYLFTRTTIAPLNWKLYLLYPVSSYRKTLLQEAGTLGLPLSAFIAAFLAFFLYVNRQVERDVMSIVSALKSGKIKEISPEQIKFREILNIGMELAETQRNIYKFKLFLEVMLKLAKKTIILTDKNFRVLIASSTAMHMFETPNLEEAIERHEWLKERMKRALFTGTEVHEERLKVKINDQEERVINLSVYPFALEDISGCIVEIDDITEEVKLQEQLMIAQKMESLGILAGGIAHDFNNIINVILGYAQILKAELKDRECERMREYIETIEKQSVRAADLIKQLLDFARASPSEKRTFDLKGVVKEYTKLIERVFPPYIEVLYEDSGEESYCIKGDLSKIHQVLMNLAVNARDAMPNGGKLIFRLKKEKGARENLIILEVEDTGCGIPPDVMEKIFDPFFTTKKTKGTGLGLSQVYGIMKEHGGSVKVRSEVGKGSTFTLFFPEAPCYHQEGVRPPKATAEPDEGEDLVKAKVLVVDDNEDLAELIEKHLSQLGAEVVKAHSIKEALEILSSQKESIDVAFVDLLLPDGEGMSLAERIKRSFPHAAIVLMSGRTDQLARISKLNVMGGITTLSKPFTSQELEKVYLEVIKETQQRGGKL